MLKLDQLNKIIICFFSNCSIPPYLEFGLFKKIFAQIPNYTALEFIPIGGVDGVMTYTNVQDYIKDNSFVGLLLLSKLDYLFRGYFIIQLLTLFINLIHYSLNNPIKIYFN